MNDAIILRVTIMCVSFKEIQEKVRRKPYSYYIIQLFSYNI